MQKRTICLGLLALPLMAGAVFEEDWKNTPIESVEPVNLEILSAFELRSQSANQAKRRAVVDVDVSDFGRFRLPNGQFRESRAGDPRVANVEMVFSPFADAAFKLSLDTLREELTIPTWSGKVVGQDDSSVTLTVTSSGMFGVVETSDRRFLVEPANHLEPSSAHVVTELDIESFSDINACVRPDPVEVGERSGKKFDPHGNDKSLSGGTLSMLVLYTSAVGAERDMAAFSASLASTFNTQLSNSYIYSGSVKLLHYAQVAYSESGETLPDILVDLRDESISGQTTLESAWNPDIVVMVVDDDITTDAPRGVALGLLCSGGCGNSIYYPGDPVEDSPAHAMRFVVEDDWAIGDYTFSHELGHALGAGHDEKEPSGTSARASDAHGHIYASDTKQTIMGGYNLDLSIVRKSFFSDKDRYDGGSLRGDSGADMLNYLPSEFAIQDDRGNNGASAPGTPSTASVTNEQCYALNTASWNSVAGADGYHVYRSPSASFTTQTLIYSGSATTVGFNVAYGQTAYVRVQACSDGGCGSYRNASGTGTYYSGCL